MLFYRYVYLLAYAFSLAGSISHRPRNATVFCQWPSSPFLPWCIPSPLFLFRCLSARCSWPTSSPLPWGVPCDGLTGDCFWWFPECMSYPGPIHLHFLFLISFSMCSCLVIFQSVVLGTLSVHFRCSILRRHLLMKVCILFSVLCVVTMSPILRIKLL